MRKRTALVSAAAAAVVLAAGVGFALSRSGSGAATEGAARRDLPRDTRSLGLVRILPDGWAAHVDAVDTTNAPKPTVVPKGKKVRVRDTGQYGTTFRRTYVAEKSAHHVPDDVGTLIGKFFESSKNWQTRWRTDKWADIHSTLLDRLRLTPDGIITVDSYRPLPDPQCQSLPYYVDYPISPCAVVSVTVTTQGGPVDFPNLVIVKELGLWKVTDAVACSYMTDLGCQRG